MLLISGRFHMKLRDIVALSFYYSIKKFYITLLKIIVTLIALFLVAKIHALLVLFIPSILCFILTIYDKPILLELEKKSSVGTLSASN